MLERIKSFLLYNADQTKENSVSALQRKKRSGFFTEYCTGLKKPLKILDIGGSDYYWRCLGFTGDDNYKIMIINTENQKTDDFTNITFLKRDARDLRFISDGEYDLVFSNSMIEHLNSYDEQKKLAGEIRRTGKKYFIQTPDYYFPLEPHFLFPFFQFLSVEMKTKLIRKYSLGWFEKQTNQENARQLAESVRLLKEKELREIFPGCKIYRERFFGLSKSLTAYN
ncbi:MAG: class I SAM-dependent methyltransferase [Ignavibacteria bacterium]|nr:class I SAM-dependent methyltransferase [Ignavibacteria bacterium]